MTRIIVAAGTEAGFRRLLAALGLDEHDSRVSRVRRVGDAALYAGSEEAVVITAAGRETISSRTISHRAAVRGAP